MDNSFCKVTGTKGRAKGAINEPLSAHGETNCPVGELKREVLKFKLELVRSTLNGGIS